ncbi:MAG: lytic murein transglycosylase, partial [Salinisphaera sp.]|nr:lytic murein transglycosylase [Salinisphaera sp.]
LVAHGVAVARHPPAADTPVGLVELQGSSGPQYWVGLQNFFVITSYNHSPLYAMAVHQLAMAIAAGRQQRASGT